MPSDKALAKASSNALAMVGQGMVSAPRELEPLPPVKLTYGLCCKSVFALQLPAGYREFSTPPSDSPSLALQMNSWAKSLRAHELGQRILDLAGPDLMAKNR